MAIGSWTAAAIAVVLLAGTQPAAAADLYGPGSPYGDPRTSQTYRYPAPPPAYAQPYPDAYRPPYAQAYPDGYQPPYAQPYADPYQPRYRGYREGRDDRDERRYDQRGYLAPMPGPPAYGRPYPDQGHPRYAERCVPRELIHEQLRRQGWSTFEGFDEEDRFVLVRARDWNGAAFDLRLDRCSGRVLDARMIERPPSDYALRYRRGYRSY